MKKIISLACCCLLSSFLVGCGDSKNNQYINYIKDAINDKKDHVWIYDFNNNKFQIYHHISNYMSLQQQLDEVFNSPDVFKDCSKTEQEINNLKDNNSITFTCTLLFNNSPVKTSKFKVIGSKLEDNQSIIDSDLNYLYNFHNNSFEMLDYGEIMEKDIIIEQLKEDCNLSKDKEVYDNCGGSQDSRVKVIGYK